MERRVNVSESSLDSDAQSLLQHWSRTLEMEPLLRSRVGGVVPAGGIDLVAMGKASREMAHAARGVWGERVRRQLIVSEIALEDDGPATLVGEHPIPGARSERAGQSLIDFLRAPSDAVTTVFLVSGGASSLCVAPAAPLTVDRLRDVWDATTAAGFDITRLNTLRAATSLISGGGVLRHVRTPETVGVVLVDNAISGAPWVASGLTYDHVVTRENLESLLDSAGVEATPLGTTLREAASTREEWMKEPPRTRVRNVVLAEPATVLDLTVAAARDLGYYVVSLGSQIDGSVEDVARRWTELLDELVDHEGPVCVVGVCEVLVQLRGSGLGGRCQEFAWAMMPVLAEYERRAIFVASSTDGRDFVEGVAGARVTTDSLARAASSGVDWARVAAENDTYHGHQRLGQLIAVGHTGWNLCDLYVALVR